MHPIVPHVPVMPESQSGPPGWLNLEPGEVFVRDYSSDGGGGKKALSLKLIALLMLGLAAQAGVYVYMMYRKGSAAGSESGQFSPMIIAGVILLLLVVFAIVLAARKMKQASGVQAVLTSKRLMFKLRGDITGFGLKEIIRLEPSKNSRNAVQIHIKRLKEPVAILGVDDMEQALAELKAYAAADGAKLA